MIFNIYIPMFVYRVAVGWWVMEGWWRMYLTVKWYVCFEWKKKVIVERHFWI
jgi:hypothetical protein